MGKFQEMREEVKAEKQLAQRRSSFVVDWREAFDSRRTPIPKTTTKILNTEKGETVNERI